MATATTTSLATIVAVLAMAATLFPIRGADAIMGKAGGPLTFDIPILPTRRQPIIVTFYGNFSTRYAVRLGRNTTGCQTANTYTSLADVPSGTLSNVVPWTPHDPQSFLVAVFTISRTTTATESAHVCYTEDGGLTWRATRSTNGGQTFFTVWPGEVPTAVAQPHVASVGHTLHVQVTGIRLEGIVRGRGVLVTSIAGCGGPSPTFVLKGGNTSLVVPKTLAGGPLLFRFTPLQPAPRVFLCATFRYKQGVGFDDWSLIPFTTANVLVGSVASGGGANRYDYNDGVTKMGLQVWGRQQWQIKASVACLQTIIAGVEARCTVRIVNSTVKTIHHSDFTILQLSDGSGTPVCPLPQLGPTPGNSDTVLVFTFTPQRAGREGTLQLSYKGVPLHIYSSPETRAYYAEFAKANYSEARNPIPGVYRDATLMKFIVHPPFTHLDTYGYTNILGSIEYFVPKTQFVFSDGVPTPFGGRGNGTVSKEMVAATLKRGVTSGSFSRTVNIPAGSVRCRATAKYYFDATVVDAYSSPNIGRMTVVLRDATSDVQTVRNFLLYNFLRRVIIVGSDRLESIDGDVKTFEQLVAEFSVRPNIVSVRIELEIYHAEASALFWADPVVRCVVVSPRTPTNEIQALQRFHTEATTGASLLTNWKSGAVWNGDPCRDRWKGVVCRHYRVVELHLQNSKLQGTLPGLQQLANLELLDISFNDFSGTLPAALANNTRLRHLDFSNNAFTAIAKGVLGLPGHQCLKTVKGARNRINRFPAQVALLPRLASLQLEDNRMTGAVPTLSGATSLEQFNVRGNVLVDSLPSLPPNSILVADFSGNGFNGTIPLQWGGLQRAQFLDVSFNRLTGTVPHALSNIRSAARLTFRASNNRLRGTMPRLPFDRIDVMNNVFKCPLPLQQYWVNGDSVVGLETHMLCDWSSAA